MKLTFTLNSRPVSCDVRADEMLLETLRKLGCRSVKCACETANCGCCTVLLDGDPVLSCSVPALRGEGREIVTLEGLQREAETFAAFMAAEGADQCGFCNPGFVMNVMAMLRELRDPTEEEIRAYLAGNLCRCTGFVSQHRAIKKFLLAMRKEENHV